MLIFCRCPYTGVCERRPVVPFVDASVIQLCAKIRRGDGDDRHRRRRSDLIKIREAPTIGEGKKVSAFAEFGFVDGPGPGRDRIRTFKFFAAVEDYADL